MFPLAKLTVGQVIEHSVFSQRGGLELDYRQPSAEERWRWPTAHWRRNRRSGADDLVETIATNK